MSWAKGLILSGPPSYEQPLAQAHALDPALGDERIGRLGNARADLVVVEAYRSAGGE